MSRMEGMIILGGGIAGLSVGYYARKKALPFTICEGDDRLGGNTVTFRHGDFLFDSGAHRVHDRNPAVTEEIKGMLGEDLKRVDVPSQIYWRGKFVDFPLSPLNLMKNLGFGGLRKAVVDMARGRLSPSGSLGTFEDYALKTYGRHIAEAFLLNYSEKLWGLPCRRLAASIAGKRLKGLDLRTFLVEALLGRMAKVDHLEGSSFYYPTGGIGKITEAMARFCEGSNVLLSSKVTRIFATSGKIGAVEINGRESIETTSKTVVSTLPLTTLVEIMRPSPPEQILSLTRGMRFRSLILVVFFLDRRSVTANATVYFPDKKFPFTRVYEPRNRDGSMSPPEKTSLVAEIPCQEGDESWKMRDGEMIRLVRSCFLEIGWIREEEIVDTEVKRLPNAYPVLEAGVEEKVRTIATFLAPLENLRLGGRNGKFRYSWIHDIMQSGREMVDTLCEENFKDCS